MNQVILDFDKDTGTQWGSHFYEEAGLCQRKAFLGRRKQEAWDAKQLNEPDDEPRSIGKIVHAVFAAYHKDGDVNIVLPSTGTSDKNTTEAIRLYGAYRQRFRPEHFGKVLDTEKLLESDVFGCPTTCRTDMIVEMEFTDCARLSLSYLTPGVWIVDHKTTKARPSEKNAIYGAKYIYGLQAPMNIVLARASGFDVKGWIANIIVRHKLLTDDSFLQVVRPYLPGRDEEVVKRYVQSTYARWKIAEETGEYQANPGACNSAYKTCPFLNNGCDQF